MQNIVIFKNNYIVELADTLSGHYYSVSLAKLDGSKGRFLGYYPSATTILNAYPTSEHLVKWIADNGFHESRAMRDEAGRRGTRIHSAIELLLGGGEIVKEGYTIEEWHKLDTFVRWHAEFKPEVLGLEIPIFSKKGKYAGRLDCIARINGELYVLDWKSSANIHKSFPLQFAAYAKAVEENSDLKIDNVAVIRLGADSIKGYQYKIYPDWRKKHYPVFQHVR